MKFSNLKSLRALTVFILSFLLTMFFISPLQAADKQDSEQKAYTLEPITVTAQKRLENVQDVPDSITVLDDIAIEDAGITDMVSLADNVPNLEFYNFGSRWHSQMFMRGIKSLCNAEPSTGLYVDGINYSKSHMFAFPLFDVERIEVLRGPQGTLYGRNTMAGVINIHTKKPGNETASAMSVTLDDYNERKFEAHLRTPVIENKLFFGITGMVTERDGYMENDVSGVGEDGRYEDGIAGRMKLRFLPAPDLDITLSLDAQKNDDGAFPFRRTSRHSFVKNGMFEEDPPYHYSHDFAGYSENEFWGAALNGAYDMDIGRLTFITGYRNFNDEDMVDSDFSPLDMARMKKELKEDSFSQEIRLSSAEKQYSFDWLIGLYYFNINADDNITNYFRPAMAGSPANPFSPDTGARLTKTSGTNEGAALFGQVTWPIVQALDLTLGMRYEYESAEMAAAVRDMPDNGIETTIGQFVSDNDFNAFLPKISIAWHFHPDRMLYATVARAHRSGGFNGPAVGGKPYDEEYSWAYEIGSKSGFLNNRLTLNITGFYTDIEDEQITRFNTYNQSYLENAGASHRLGVETEINYALRRGLDLKASLSLIEAEYDEYTDPVTGADYENKKIFNVPDCTYSIALQYRRPLWRDYSLFGNIKYSGVGDRYFDDANTVEETSYELCSIKIGLEGRHMDYYVWVNNLFDQQYRIFENTVRGITEDGEPRVFGGSVTYRF
jgi:iron complex outermembrane receptor protein